MNTAKPTLSELAVEISKKMLSDYRRTVQPCDAGQYERTRRLFQSRFNFELPEAYRTVMLICNGVKYNGMTICPVSKSAGFRENIVEFNDDMQGTIDPELIYLGQMDEELCVRDEEKRIYCAKEMGGLPTWNEFNSAEEMFVFLLRRAMYMDLVED